MHIKGPKDDLNLKTKIDDHLRGREDQTLYSKYYTNYNESETSGEKVSIN